MIMCDLFALSAGRRYSVPEALSVFALRAKNNMDGWGIGYFKKDTARVEKSFQHVFSEGHFHDSFERLARVVNSRTIIAHVRFRTSGPIDECHAHPFALHFAGHDWIFAHNGRAPLIESYRTIGEPLPGAVSDSARTFEYLRDRLIIRYPWAPEPSSLFGALLATCMELVDEYPGNYNFILANESVLFAFSNHRQLMVLRGTRELQGASMLTTLEKGLSSDRWVRVARSTPSKGVLLAVAGGDVILLQFLR